MFIIAQQHEAKFVREWLQTFHPEALQWRRVRIGPLPDKELARMYMVKLRWVDAIYKENAIVHILEAKLRPDAGGISQLELYDRLFAQTPEFTEWHGLQHKLIFLTTRSDPDLEAMCADKNIEYVVYSPKWLMEVLSHGSRFR